MTRFHPEVTVRLADSADQNALVRLATLDSAAVPPSPIVVAETGGELVAAVAIDDSATIADPFQRTAALVQMLKLRAVQLRSEGPGRGSLRGRLAGALGDSRPIPHRA